MKYSSLFNLLVMGLALAIGGVGCKHGTKAPTPIPAARSNPQGPGPVGPVGPGPNTQGAQLPPPSNPLPLDTNPKGTDLPRSASGTELPPNAEDFQGRPANREIFKAYTVYFEFDRSSVKPDQMPKLQAVADFMKNAPAGNDLAVEGHCDERGTDEYNRALGERRALAAREVLMNSGVAASRIITISYGKDKPVDPNHNDDAWSKNRRAEFLLLLPKK